MILDILKDTLLDTIKLIPFFEVFASLKHSLFQQGTRIRAILLLASGWSSG